MLDIKEKIRDIIKLAFLKAYINGEIPNMEIPNIVVNQGGGDYSSPVCLQVANKIGMKPLELAGILNNYMMPPQKELKATELLKRWDEL